MPITESDLALRLRQARESAGLTQEEVAQALALPRSSVAQMELGNRSVSSLELDRLARLYGRTLDELLAADFDPEATLVAIFRADAAAPEEAALLDTATHAIAFAREMANLEELLEIERIVLHAPTYPVPVPRAKWEAVRQGSQAAAEERSRLHLGDAPLGDAADLLESQGVRTALLELPDDISGLTLMDPRLSFFVVNNSRHAVLRRRFSWLHEYAHVLFDRDQRGTVSRGSARDELVEVRANAFAACFLLPPGGARQFLESLGKGQGSRERWDLYDEDEDRSPVSAEGRPEPGSQTIQLYDVIRLAHRFGVSRIAAIYRLKNLRLISQADLEGLLQQERDGQGLAIERSLGLGPWRPRRERQHEPGRDGVEPEIADFRTRFLSLALEAYRRDKISRGKIHELGRLVEASPDEIDDLLDRLGFLGGEEDTDFLLPGD